MRVFRVFRGLIKKTRDMLFVKSSFLHEYIYIYGRTNGSSGLSLVREAPDRYTYVQVGVHSIVHGSGSDRF
jgi:hypothetical protein